MDFHIEGQGQTQGKIQPLKYLQEVRPPGSEASGGSVIKKKKNSPANAEEARYLGSIPWGRKWQPIPVFLPGESHGQRRLAGCSPWGCRVRHN